jgi:hypothetical protein
VEEVGVGAAPVMAYGTTMRRWPLELLLRRGERRGWDTNITGSSSSARERG